MAALMGIKNRNLAVGETFYYRELCYYIQNANTTAPAPTGAVIRFSFPEAMVLVEAQASVHQIGGGITTFTVDVRNSAGSMLASAMSLKAHAQEVVVGINGASTALAAREVGQILVTNSNNENVFNVSIKATFRPKVGQETRL